MIGIIGGIFGGISGALIIWLVQLAQVMREAHPSWIFILPFAGILITYLKGSPKLIIGSFLTHLGGGSAGREGAVVNLGKIFAEKASYIFKYQERNKRRLILVSVGAGFGAALGAPWAGVLFGFEYNKSTFFRVRTMVHSGVAMLIAQVIVRLSKVPHFHLPEFETPDYAIKNFVFVMIAGILFGFATAFFHYLRHHTEDFVKKHSPALVAFIGGCILTAIFYFLDLNDYQGLGKETITRSSQEILSITVTLKKILISVLTLSTGFQGGEFFPLAFMGSTLGSALSFVDPTLTALLVALGFVSTYGASTQTPIACTVLACELFGPKILPFAAINLWIAYRIHTGTSIPSRE